ncbi:unnamed protein product [Zymoseptoria tritici ST99CH_1A5]|uniref:Apple domain-containing protein n=1 Tax=Zymoseptoria tritici ST99CH_1A5 TaxID=1276529 RepID=A0A1Y6LP80_ZYMTR|nr:unnamed protein product [Zymoseptoria tritici ST99CH_1A5]
MPTVCKSQIDAICVPNTAIFSETCCVSSGNTCQETTPNDYACRPAMCQTRTDATCVPDSTVLSETCCPESGNVCTPGTPGTYSCRPEMFVCQNGRPGSSTGNKNKIDITCNQRYTTIGNGGNNNAVINEQLTATVQQCGSLCAANGNCNNINYFRQTSTSGFGRPMLCQQLYTRDFGLVDDDGVDSGSKTA